MELTKWGHSSIAYSQNTVVYIIQLPKISLRIDDAHKLSKVVDQPGLVNWLLHAINDVPAFSS